MELFYYLVDQLAALTQRPQLLFLQLKFDFLFS
jgi:hypothetical protein